ncbi:MAG: LL-diaminopimelate aminotransferase [Desulfamplus sp.]|nr:LL-diaminopimelate aminotransferase [Desulfamplus sp.]
MIKVNEHYNKLVSSYLFSDIASRVAKYQQENPDMEIIRLGIGDVTRALPRACIDAFKKGVEEMALDATFRGYGPEKGYAFLREKIALRDFREKGADIDAEEIFVSDGAKCDTANFQELFSRDISIAIPDPVYPVYLDSNVMAGRTGSFEEGRYHGIHYLECVGDNGFLPGIPDFPVDLIYLCSPNNPTGTVITREGLAGWVEYARENRALILFDAAYEAFIRDESLPKSIYEIQGAKEVAVEFRSFSKTAGFTGTRCAYTVVPRECRVFDESGSSISLHDLWNRRQSTKFNGVSYPVQRAAEAVYSEEGGIQTKALVSYYLKNAELIRTAMAELGFSFVGGDNSPYIWVDGNGRDSWDFFDMLLAGAGVVCTPGAGFGRCGRGYIRISAFNSRENVEKAMQRVADVL